MKIRHLYSFFADVYAFFHSRALFFVKITLFAIFDKAEAFVVLATNINQQNTVRLQQTQIKKHNLFSKHQTTLAPQTTIKQTRFYKPRAYDKQLGFNKPAVVIGDSLFAVFRHLCFNGCLCDMQHPCKVGFQNKHTANRRRSPINKHLSKIIVFTIRQRKIIRTQTTRINVICILHPFTSKIITSVLMPTVNNTNLGFPSCF